MDQSLILTSKPPLKLTCDSWLELGRHLGMQPPALAFVAPRPARTSDPDLFHNRPSQSHTLRPSASGTEYECTECMRWCIGVAGWRGGGRPAWLLLAACMLAAAGPCWRLLRQPSLFSICCCTRDSTDGRWARTPVVGTTTVVVLGRRSQGCAAARRRRWLLLTGWPRCTAGTRGRCQGRGLGSLRGSNCHVVPEWP
jgi:hypothetical protein